MAKTAKEVITSIDRGQARLRQRIADLEARDSKRQAVAARTVAEDTHIESVARTIIEREGRGAPNAATALARAQKTGVKQALAYRLIRPEQEAALQAALDGARAEGEEDFSDNGATPGGAAVHTFGEQVGPNDGVLNMSRPLAEQLLKSYALETMRHYGGNFGTWLAWWKTAEVNLARAIHGQPPLPAYRLPQYGRGVDFGADMSAESLIALVKRNVDPNTAQQLFRDPPMYRAKPQK